MKPIPLILASDSPRRRDLLKQINLDFEVRPSTVEEDFSLPLPPAELAEHYATLKARDVAARHPDHLVIGADTIVVLEDQILGKPQDVNESYRMLRSLSGKTHTVITAVALQGLKRSIDECFHERTRVTLRALEEDEIHYYIRTYKPFDKAGSYGIQDWFSVCVERIEGCFYNVVGFPLATFYRRYQQIIQAAQSS